MSTPSVGTVGTVGTAVTPDTRSRLRRARGPVVLGLLLVLMAVLVTLAAGQQRAGFLDPDAVDPSGSRALASLLEQQGVTVVRVTTAQAAAEAVGDAGADGATLLVAPTAPLSSGMADAVTAVPARRWVLVAPDQETLALLAPWADVAGYSDATDEVEPGCTWDVAGLVGPLAPAGPTYGTSRSEALRCWDGAALHLPASSSERDTTVLGMPDAFTNDVLADSGNAALGMNVLGGSPTLVWWLPSAQDPLQFEDGEAPSIGDLVPTWVRWALAQVALALLVVVWWRARRLGRVVVEPLPVVVRSTEAVEGRARLYRRASARGRAADALRRATISRLRARLGVPRSAAPGELVSAVAARTGRDPADVARLLQPGLDPTDDAGLTRLADALDTLEDEVRRS